VTGLRGYRGHVRTVVAVALAAGLLLVQAATAVVAAGPPFPPPVNDQAVYDTAGVLRADTIRQAEAIIDGVEQRTGAEVVVYTQLVPSGITTAEAEQDAIALMDQWGVGRKGFDDGLVILFDLHQGDACHGQVQLYAGPGYRAKFLTNEERQAIFENDMLPLLRQCDLDGALMAALGKVDASATADHAASLNFFRILNAILGLLVAPALALLIVGWGLVRWLQHGRDPVYLDDPSIHIPAAPRGLTPAAGAVVRDGRATRRALTAASLDLASRGQIAFRPETTGLLMKTTKIGVEINPAVPADAAEQARVALAQRRPIDDATGYLDTRLRGLAGSDGRIEPDDLLKLGSHVTEFNTQIEQHVVAQGWFGEPPGKATSRWVARGVTVMILGGVALFGGSNLPSDGLVLLGIGLLLAGGVLLGLARSMPARTMPGAMIRAMLEAYRRTLQKTMAQARSMGEVVAASAIPLIEDPDDAVVWGVALGLQDEIEGVLGRTADDLEHGRATGGYLPMWYGSGAGGPAGGGSGGWAPGTMSSSAIPNFSGMMAALGTIGNSPSSSGSGGGFGGGGSGGGGGGAGGGF
jgi:uncharacterized membrane protein YgcG